MYIPFYGLRDMAGFTVFIAATLLLVAMTAAQPQLPNNIPRIPANPSSRGSNMVPGRMSAQQTGSAGNAAMAANCISMGRDVVTRCFQTNGGYQMQYVVAILSNGTQGPMPRNSQQMIANMCASQGVIIACIFSGISSLRSTQQCPTMPEYIRLEQETITLVSTLQQLCGSGPLPVADPCHRTLFSSLQQCYVSAGLNPEVFSPNNTAVTRAAGPSHVIGAVIGDNPQTAGKFCRGWFSPKMKRVKRELFSCMKKAVDQCPGALELLSLSGYDQEAIKKGIDVLCHDVDVYVDGMRCFQNRSPEVNRCYQSLLERVTDLSAEQVRTNMPLAQYNARYCQIRIEHMDCDLSAWGQRCAADAVGLKNEFECNLLPSSCKNDRAVQRRLQQTCAVERFARQLRSGSSRRFSMTSSLVMTFVTVATVIFLL